MAEVTLAVRGLTDEETAVRVEATLFAKVVVRDVKADWEAGRVWLSYDERVVPQPRLRSYLQGVGLTVVQSG